LRELVDGIEARLYEQKTEKQKSDAERVASHRRYIDAQTKLKDSIRKYQAAHDASSQSLNPETARDTAETAQQQCRNVEDFDKAAQEYAQCQAKNSALDANHAALNQKNLESISALRDKIENDTKKRKHDEI
jgi:hypothetical protein